MSVTDGGSFKCYQHEEVFETTNPQKWEEHIAEGHTESGTSACAVCGKTTTYSHKAIGKKPLCDDCKEDLRK